MTASFTDTELVTARLRLRPPRRGDFYAWRELRQASRTFLKPWEPEWPDDALSRDHWIRQMRAWRHGWRREERYSFFIFALADSRLIGGVTISNVRRGPAETGTLGYWLGEAHQGKGYMTEAVEAVCQWGFEALGLLRIEAATLVDNVRSQAVLERCGFVREGVARAYLEIAGRRQDHILFARTLNQSEA